jgi:hypothetical protein
LKAKTSGNVSLGLESVGTLSRYVLGWLWPLTVSIPSIEVPVGAPVIEQPVDGVPGVVGVVPRALLPPVELPPEVDALPEEPVAGLPDRELAVVPVLEADPLRLPLAPVAAVVLPVEASPERALELDWLPPQPATRAATVNTKWSQAGT